MADVVTRARERGQLFLVSGLTLAVLFVALAFLLNTAIYTENVATRSSEDRAVEAVELVAVADRGVGGAVRRVNYRANGTDYVALENAANRTVGNWSNLTARQTALEGRSINVSLTDRRRGTRIVQYASRNMTNASGNSTWTLVTGVDATRRFRLNVNRSHLAAASAGIDDAFAVVIDDGTERTVSVYRNDTTGETNVTVDSGAGSSATCTDATGSHTEIDLVGATVGGERCAALDSLLDGEGHNIRYENGSEAVGRYELVVAKPIGDVDADQYNAEGGPAPYNTTALYSVDASVTVAGPDVHYRRTVTVEPADRGPLGGSGGVPSGNDGGGAGSVDATIDNTSVDNGTGNSPDTVSVGWSATDAGGDLERIHVVVTDDGGTEADAYKYVSGGSASGTTDVRIRGSGDYTITVTAEDENGNTDTETTIVSSS